MYPRQIENCYDEQNCYGHIELTTLIPTESISARWNVQQAPSELKNPQRSPQYLYLSLFSVKVCHFLASDMGLGGREKKDYKVWHGGGGSKMAFFGVAYFLNGPFIFSTSA